MENETKMIAERLKMARQNAGISAEVMAQTCNIATAEYLKAEQGADDFSFSFLYKCANALDMDISELVSGVDPKLGFFDLTRAGEGMPIKRREGFCYRHMAPKLKNRVSEPFIVTARYYESEQDKAIHLSTHKGQEFDMVLEGQLKVRLEDHVFTMYEGDTLYYDSSHPHGMIATGGSDCKFLAVVFRDDGSVSTIPAPEPVTVRGKGYDIEKYKDCIYHRFAKETISPEGKLLSMDFTVPDNFNYGYDVVDELAKKCPDKLALLWVGDDFTEKRYTFADIARLSTQTANYFASLGIGKGDRVMLVLKRHVHFWLSIIALHKLGATAVPATNMLVKKDFVYRFTKGKIKAIVCTTDGSCLDEAEKASVECPLLQIKIAVGEEKQGWHDFNTEYKAFPETINRVPTSKDDPLLAFFSSGTTGYPKMAVHKATYPLGHIVTARWWQTVDPEGVHLTVADTGWGKALWGKLYGQWLCEAAVFVYDYDRFDAEKLLSLFPKYHITTFCAPPTIYRFFIKNQLEKHDLSSVSHASIAGEALNPEVYNRFREATGLLLTEGFGQTETTLTVGNLYGNSLKPGSMGKPVPTYDVDIIRENGESAAVGETGEIVIRTQKEIPNGLFSNYFDDEENTKKAWHDGIYHTGDTAWRDEDGYYWYVGRVDDLIKSSGYRIGPFEIESVIMELPYVLECAVTGVPDETRGQVVKATIVLTDAREPSDELVKEIQDYVKKQTAPYKYPRKVEFVKELPKTISGKIRRSEIRKDK